MIDGRSLTDPALRHLFEAFSVPSVHLDGLTALRGWRPDLDVAPVGAGKADRLRGRR